MRKLRDMKVSSAVASRLLFVGCVSGLSSACSSDTMRFAESPFQNSARVARSEPVITSSVTSAPSIPVQSQPLAKPAPVQMSSLSAPVAAPSTYKPAVQTLGSKVISAGGWTSQGGTPVQVRAGDDLNLLANRYGVPASAILAVNGLASASQVQEGRELTIPVFNANSTKSPIADSRQIQKAPVVAEKPAQVASSFEDLPSPVQRPSLPQTVKAETVKATSAKIEAAKAETTQNLASRPVRQIKIDRPAEEVVQKLEPAKVATVVPVEKPIVPVAEKAIVAKPVLTKPAQVSEPVRVAATEPTQTASLPAATSSASSAEFRWPAKGRIISGFSNGNEGISIAVPEGTPVKAAESGTVAYAGEELKGYGKLVLIRHDNGFVSAYANNSDLKVKRGDKVQRGQPIAASGRTGNVTSPQLHFEIRKGSTPVDPVPYLSGG